MAALLFIPVGTFDYWQAWLFMAVFVGSSAATTVYLAINDPKLLERRMNAGAYCGNRANTGSFDQKTPI